MKNPDIKIFNHDVHHDYRGELWTIWKQDEYPETNLTFNHLKKTCFTRITRRL